MKVYLILNVILLLQAMKNIEIPDGQELKIEVPGKSKKEIKLKIDGEEVVLELKRTF